MAQHQNDLETRFWAKVLKTDECWLWTASKGAKGYGFIGLGNGKVGKSHRVSWELHNGAIPDGIHVLHNCPGKDNPACVNPAHLWLGTNDDNMKDAARKDCFPHSKPAEAGEKHWNARLTWQDVDTIRMLYATAGVSGVRLAQQYSVSQSNISQILHNKRWTR